MLTENKSEAVTNGSIISQREKVNVKFENCVAKNCFNYGFYSDAGGVKFTDCTIENIVPSYVVLNMPTPYPYIHSRNNTRAGAAFISGSTGIKLFELVEVTFSDLQNGETITLAGLTYTAPYNVTAQFVASVFENLTVNYVGTGNLSGTLTDFNTGSANGNTVIFTNDTKGNNTGISLDDNDTGSVNNISITPASKRYPLQIKGGEIINVPKLHKGIYGISKALFDSVVIENVTDDTDDFENIGDNSNSYSGALYY
ncbi:hypothetical protein NBRC110019_12010 [Neptunitalea chrysea]|uniref:Uncharacterized protein n=1 Tax=Neptunitalea chrysea TaxID=1647581 RepID=A0A9W6EV66_9FLAO|nr:hypothetical protein [Neptunitalea chrysea]GLB52162.1 hypothetical protein NBRC110019_12010 [Neptunitalea chrysea]